VGAAMMVSCGAAIVTESFPARETGRGLGFFGVAASMGFILGPVVGGLLLDWLSWRSIFYVRVPMGLITLAMSWRLLKKDRIRTDPIHLDLAGTCFSTAGLFFIIYGMSLASRFGLSSSRVLGLVGAGLASIFLFAAVERKVRAPLIDLDLFRNRIFSGATLSLFLTFVAAPFYILIMPFYLMEGVALSPSSAGLLMASLSLTTIAVGPISGWLSDRYGPVWFSTSGAWIMALAFFAMRGFDLQTTVGEIIPILVLMGVGIGTFQAPNNSTIMKAAPRDRLGTASAIIATVRQVGMSLGMAMAGAIFTVRQILHQSELTSNGVELGYAARMAIPLAFKEAILISVSLSLLIGFLSLLTGAKADGQGKDRPETASLGVPSQEAK